MWTGPGSWWVCTDSDETNVYVTLLVRKLNPDARVIAVAGTRRTPISSPRGDR
ncbi:NAD-binding protein [Methanopyrus kandleri]